MPLVAARSLGFDEPERVSVLRSAALRAALALDIAATTNTPVDQNALRSLADVLRPLLESGSATLKPAHGEPTKGLANPSARLFVYWGFGDESDNVDSEEAQREAVQFIDKLLAVGTSTDSETLGALRDRCLQLATAAEKWHESGFFEEPPTQVE